MYIRKAIEVKAGLAFICTCMYVYIFVEWERGRNRGVVKNEV